MKSKWNFYRQNSELTPDITPLIDIVFLLLIFFMIASTFNKNKEIDIALPKSSNHNSIIKKNSENISIYLDKNRKIKLVSNNQNEKFISENNIENEISTSLKNSNNKFVSIYADKSLNYGEIIGILEKIKMAGATGVELKIEEK